MKLEDKPNRLRVQHQAKNEHKLRLGRDLKLLSPLCLGSLVDSQKQETGRPTKSRTFKSHVRQTPDYEKMPSSLRQQLPSGTTAETSEFQYSHEEIYDVHNTNTIWLTDCLQHIRKPRHIHKPRCLDIEWLQNHIRPYSCS